MNNPRTNPTALAAPDTPGKRGARAATQPTEAMRRRVARATPSNGHSVADLLEQIDAARRGTTSRIDLQPGRYELYPHDLPARPCYVSNNDSGVRPVLFNLTDRHGLEIDGHGAELICHGEIIPFMVERCRDLRIANLTIDWQRPFLSQGLVLDADADRIDLDMDPEHPFEVRDGRPIFVGRHYESNCLHNMLAFDPQRRETAFRAIDHYGIMKSLRAERLGTEAETRLRLLGSFTQPPAPGQAMVIKHHGRTAPGLCFAHCRNVSLEDLTVHHAGGMAFVAQATRDIALRRCRVEPRQGSNRLFSAHADATHFTDCHGRIELIDCHFANQLDDATNIHGIFRRVDGDGTTDRLHARLVHPQQDGIETLSPGDTVALIDDRDFATLAHAAVTSVENPDTASATYTLDRSVQLREGHTIAMRWDHDIDVRIAGCHASGNRARGLLISTLGRVVIEHNHLHVPGSAIQFNCDGNSWYESGPVEDVTIRHNHFDNCLFGVWGAALFSARPEIKPQHRGQPVHHNIRITDNRITAADPRLLYAHSVAGLLFTNNTLTHSDAYPHDQTSPPFNLGQAVTDVTLDEIPPPDTIT